jgi:hypothetical protein
MVERRRTGRVIDRLWRIALGVAAALLLTAAPAAASGGTRSTIAFWDLDDLMHTRVSLQGTAAANAEQPGSLFLFVTQSYCDTATDEMVFRSFFSQQPLDPGSFRVHPQLKWARLSTSTSVTGSEQRLVGCASTSGFPTSNSLGPSMIDIETSWTATGPAYEVQPGITARDAVATGSITGSTLTVGPMGDSQFAQLRSQA